MAMVCILLLGCYFVVSGVVCFDLVDVSTCMLILWVWQDPFSCCLVILVTYFGICTMRF